MPPASPARTPPPVAAKTRVIVVDDSALVRALLSQIIDQQPDMQCIATAGDPLEARELIRSLNPDVVTLDVEMPRMDGIEFLSRLMRLRPMPVVMISTLTAKGADTTLRALELGAVDYVCKPGGNLKARLQDLAEDIAQKIRVAARARVRRVVAPPQAVATGKADEQGHWPVNGRVVFIGASTGGTEATRELLERLPADSPPIVVAQHMPAGFTASYAQRLNALLPLRVLEARDGLRLRGGHVYIAPGGLHTSVERGVALLLRVTDGAPVNRHKPSVEVLFRSAARVVGGQALGVMLTGMGADGASAMREMRDAGAFNLCQDEASCVVFGMPREAISAGAAHEVMPPHAMAERLQRVFRSGR